MDRPIAGTEGQSFDGGAIAVPSVFAPEARCAKCFCVTAVIV